jgi:hypothetical protein
MKKASEPGKIRVRLSIWLTSEWPRTIAHSPQERVYQSTFPRPCLPPAHFFLCGFVVARQVNTAIHFGQVPSARNRPFQPTFPVYGNSLLPLSLPTILIGHESLEDSMVAIHRGGCLARDRGICVDTYEHSYHQHSTESAAFR